MTSNLQIEAGCGQLDGEAEEHAYHLGGMRRTTERHRFYTIAAHVILYRIGGNTGGVPDPFPGSCHLFQVRLSRMLNTDRNDHNPSSQWYRVARRISGRQHLVLCCRMSLYNWTLLLEGVKREVPYHKEWICKIPVNLDSSELLLLVLRSAVLHTGRERARLHTDREQPPHHMDPDMPVLFLPHKHLLSQLPLLVPFAA